jgi:hypothetical protein
MATENLNLNVNVNTNGVDNSVGSLKKQLREAQADVVVLSDKFGATSVQAIEAAKKVGVLKDKIGDAKALSDAFNPDAKFKALTASLAGAAGGFGAVQGAMALFGAESDNVQKTLLKVQSAMAISQGLQAVGESIDSFKNLGAVIKSSETFQKLNTTTTAAAAIVQRLFTGTVNETTVSFKFLKVAIAATGIGLFLVALGTLVAYWDDIKGAIGGVNVEQGKLNVQSTKNLKTEQDKLEAIDGQTNQLKLQGKSEREILDIKMKQTEEAIKAATINVENAKITKKLQVEASERNKEILTGIVKFMAIPITLLLTTIDEIGKALGKNFQLLKGFTGGLSNLIFDPKKTAEEGDKTIKIAEKDLATLKEKNAGYKLSVNELNKKDAEDKQKLADSFAAFTLNAKLQQQADDRAFIEDGKKLQADADKADADAAKVAEEDRIAGLQYRTARVLQINKAEQDIKKADAADEIELKKAQAQETMKLMGDLSSFIAKDSIAGKALGIATATINTYQGASEALKQKSTLPSPFDVIAKVANVTSIIATGIKTVKSIASVQMPGGGGGGIPSLSNISPMIPQIPQAGTTNISQESINDLGNKAVRAYVIESDVTSNQQRITAIRQRARFS